MVEVPWLVANHRAFLLPPLLVLALLASLLVPDRFPAVFGEAADDLKATPAPAYAFGVVVLVGFASWAYFRTFQRFAEVVDALGDRVASVEVVDLMRHTSLHCTTHDGRDFHLYYNGGSKYSPAYYQLWIETSGRRPDVAPARYAGPIEHLNGITVEPGEREGTWKLTAELSDAWLTSETPDILKSLDALYEIKEGR